MVVVGIFKVKNNTHNKRSPLCMDALYIGAETLLYRGECKQVGLFFMCIGGSLINSVHIATYCIRL